MDKVPYLRTRSLPLRPQDILKVEKNIRMGFEHLTKFMEDHPTAEGIAAIQFQVPAPIFVFRYKGNIEKVLNPEIIKSTGHIRKYEGSISFPFLYAYVERPAKIKVRYYNEELKQVQRTLTGKDARVFHHYWDHLQGRVIFDRAIRRTDWNPEHSPVRRVSSDKYKTDFYIAGKNILFFSGLSLKEGGTVVGIEMMPEKEEEKKEIIQIPKDDKYKQTQSGIYIPKE